MAVRRATVTVSDGVRTVSCACGHTGPASVHDCPSFRQHCGPGCQLRRTLAWFGIRDDGTCGCEEMAAKMDAWGDACWAHLEEIVDHLRGAAEKRGIPFLATAARIAVGRAIEAAKAER